MNGHGKQNRLKYENNIEEIALLQPRVEATCRGSQPSK